jgi:hypothetical protein
LLLLLMMYLFLTSISDQTRYNLRHEIFTHLTRSVEARFYAYTQRVFSSTLCDICLIIYTPRAILYFGETLSNLIYSACYVILGETLSNLIYIECYVIFWRDIV